MARMKSGLLVLVDLFSLLTMAEFATFVIASDFARPEQAEPPAIKIVELTVSPQGLPDKFSHLASADLVEFGARLVDQNGEPVKPQSRGVRMEVATMRDGLVVTLTGKSRGLKVVFEVAEVRLPVALLATYKARVTGLLGSQGPIKRDDLQVGDWDLEGLEVS